MISLTISILYTQRCTSGLGLAEFAVEQLVLYLNENDVSYQSLGTSRIEKEICGLSGINLLLVGTATINPSSYQRDKYLLMCFAC